MNKHLPVCLFDLEWYTDRLNVRHFQTFIHTGWLWPPDKGFKDSVVTIMSHFHVVNCLPPCCQAKGLNSQLNYLDISGTTKSTSTNTTPTFWHFLTCLTYDLFIQFILIRPSFSQSSLTISKYTLYNIRLNFKLRSSSQKERPWRQYTRSQHSINI